ncbi:hypothetical protein L3V79_08925 [Thiotrichales bacterium 19S9-12]|nr:hypothetical protein [Thiotrichales bacterium 19S9-11]MCF6812479.1 hypothetical protein [Thiotrichales bacterium 19S9-12]
MQYAVTPLSKQSFIEACNEVLEIIGKVGGDEARKKINALKLKVSNKKEKLISPHLKSTEFNESISELKNQIDSLKGSNPKLATKLDKIWNGLVKQLVPSQQKTSPEPKFLPKNLDTEAEKRSCFF